MATHGRPHHIETCGHTIWCRGKDGQLYNLDRFYYLGLQNRLQGSLYLGQLFLAIGRALTNMEYGEIKY